MKKIAKCPRCGRDMKHSSEYGDVPFGYNTFYCKPCKTMTYTDDFRLEK